MAYRVPRRYCSSVIVGSDASRSTALVDAKPRSVVSARVPSTSQMTAVAEAKSGSGETEGEARTPSSADDARGFVVAVVRVRG